MLPRKLTAVKKQIRVIFLYLIKSFEISTFFKIKERRPEIDTYIFKNESVKKSYSLTPEKSISFSQRYKIVQVKENINGKQGKKNLAFLEAEIKSVVKFPIILTAVDVNPIGDCEFLGFFNQAKGQEIPPRAVFKLLGRFECNNLVVRNN